CNVAHDWFGDVIFDVFSSFFFCVATNFTNHDDGLGFIIIFESFQRVDVRGADDGVATDTNCGRNTDPGQFVHHLVGQRTGLGDQTDWTVAGDVCWGNAGQRGTRCDDTGAVWPDNAGL